MRPSILVGALVSLFLALPYAAAQEWFDGLVARVNGEPLLVSDITRYEWMFGSGKAFEALSPMQREESISRLIRRTLLLSEAGRFRIADPDTARVKERARQLRARLAAAGHTISPERIEKEARNELWVEQFVQARIRAFVLIRDPDVEAALAEEGGPRPGESPEQARQRVREQLSNLEAGRRLDEYVTRLLTRAEIRRYPVDPALLQEP